MTNENTTPEPRHKVDSSTAINTSGEMPEMTAEEKAVDESAHVPEAVQMTEAQFFEILKETQQAFETLGLFIQNVYKDTPNKLEAMNELRRCQMFLNGCPFEPKKSIAITPEVRAQVAENVKASHAANDEALAA